MARVIEFYIPWRYRRKIRWVPPQSRGKVLVFRKRPKSLTEEGWRILGITGDPAAYFKIPGTR